MNANTPWSANLLKVGTVKPNPHRNTRTHSHPYWEFVCLRERRGSVEPPDTEINVREYHIIAYPPGLAHAEGADALRSEGTVFLCVDIEGDFAKGPLLLPDCDGKLRWLCERMLEEYSKYGVNPIADAYLQAFLHLIDRLQLAIAVTPLQPIDLVLEQIHSNYQHNLSLDFLAAIACMSKPYFVNQFRKLVGQSPMRYLQKVRIEAAKRLLAASNMSITEVALVSGFRDPLYFSRVFQRNIGCAPTTFRQKNSDSTLS